MRFVLPIIVVAVASLSASVLLAGGRLDRARSEIQEASGDDKPSKPSKPTDSWFDQDNDCCEDGSTSLSDGFGEIIGVGVLGALTVPWWGPRSLLADDDSVMSIAEFPYTEDWPGYFVNQDPTPDWSKSWSARLLTEYGSDFAGLTNYGGRLRIDSLSRIGFDTEWNHRREKSPGVHDSLWSGDANLVYRFAQSPRAAFYTGVGLNWSADDRYRDVGFNFTYGADLFPVKPLVLSGSIDWGRLGDASLFHGRATIGAMLNRVEVFTGYDYLNLEGTGFPSLVVGMQISF